MATDGFGPARARGGALWFRDPTPPPSPASSAKTTPRIQHALDMHALAAHWAELPRREQKILLLRFYGDMTQADIGHQLGISQMHVSRLLAHALTHLRHRLLATDTPAPHLAKAS